MAKNDKKTETKETKEDTSNVPATQTQGGSVATYGGKALPAHLQKHMGAGGRGLGNIDADDVEIPRIKLLQGISKEVTNGAGRAGEFYHTVSEAAIGKKLIITPIFVFKSYILWRPRHQGGGILARALDGRTWTPGSGEFEVCPLKDNPNLKAKWKLAKTVKESGLDDWGSSNPADPNSPPAATKMINVVSFDHERPETSPYVITLQRSSSKVGKKLTGKLRMTPLPCYALTFEVTPFLDKNNRGEEFFNYQFTQTGLVEDEGLFGQLEALNKTFETKGVNIKDVEGLADDDTPDSGAGGGGGDSDVDERV